MACQQVWTWIKGLLWLEVDGVLRYFPCQRKCPCIVYRIVTSLYSVGALLSWTIVANTYLKYNALMYLTTWTYIVQCLYNGLAVAGPFYITKLQQASRTGDISNPTYNSCDTSEGDVSHLEDTRDDVARQNSSSSQHPNNNNCNRCLSTIICLSNGSANETPPISRGYYVFLCLWSVTASIQSVFDFVVTGVYYITLCHGDPHCSQWENVNVHAFNSLFIFIDICCSRPVSFLQVCYPLVYGLTYVVFTVIAWVVDNTIVIYSILDWNQPLHSGLSVFGILLLAIVVHIVVCLIITCLRTKCTKQNEAQLLR